MENRIIKFRAPYIEDGEDTGEWCFFELGGLEMGYDGMAQVDVSRAEQFIGLQDETGRDMYEGDKFNVGNIITGSVGLRPGFVFNEDQSFVVSWDKKWHAWSFDMTGLNLEDMEDNTYINQVRAFMLRGDIKVVDDADKTPPGTK